MPIEWGSITVPYMCMPSDFSFCHIIGFSEHRYCDVHISMYTVDREIFVVKVIHILNFCVKNISPPDGSAM